MVDDVLAASALDARDVERLRWTGSEDVARRLGELNRSRDLLLRGGGLALLTADDEPGLRAVKAVAFDLVSAPDLDFVVRTAQTAIPWEDLAASLRQLSAGHSAWVDLRGLSLSKHARFYVEDIYVDLLDRSPTGRRVLVIGEPGAGKTTTLRHLAAVYGPETSDPLGIGAKVPLMVPLGAWAQAWTRSVTIGFDVFLDEWLEQHGVRGSPRGHEEDLLILADGLDEVRGVDQRRRVLTELLRFASEHRVGGLVVSARAMTIDELRGSEDAFDVVTLRAPKAGELGALVKVLNPPFDAGHEEEVPAAPTPLAIALLGGAHLYFDDPDFLGMVVGVHLAVWDRCIRSVRGSTGTPLHSDDVAARELLGAVAAHLLFERRWDLGADELRALVAVRGERRHLRKQAEALAEALVPLLTEEGGTLLVATRPRAWGFAHPILLSWFAANRPERTRWSINPYDADWLDAWAFRVGRLARSRGEVGASIGDRLYRWSHHSVDARVPTLLASVLRAPDLPPGLGRRLAVRFVQVCFHPGYGPVGARHVAGLLTEVAGRLGKGPTRPAFERALNEAIRGPVPPDIAAVLGAVHVALGR